MGRLTSLDPAHKVEVLGAQAIALEALSLHFMRRSLSTTSEDASVKFAKLALGAQAGFVRVLGAMEALRGRPPVIGE